jgi:hypothetical protein
MTAAAGEDHVRQDFLRQAREAKSISLQEIAERTRISPWILQRLDAGEFGALPAGIYARAYLRAFASAVGLDPDMTVRQVEGALPQPDSSSKADADMVAQMNARQRAIAAASNTRVGPEAMLSMRPRFAAARQVMHQQVPRITRRQLYAAAVIDTAFLILVNLGLLGVSAYVCGMSVFQMFEYAPAPMFLLFGVAATSYFCLLGGVAGRTLGAYSLGIRLIESPKAPMDLLAIGRRAGRCLIAESAILIGALIPTVGSRPQPPTTPPGNDAAPTAQFHVMPKRIQAGR